MLNPNGNKKVQVTTEIVGKKEYEDNKVRSKALKEEASLEIKKNKALLESERNIESKYNFNNTRLSKKDVFEKIDEENETRFQKKNLKDESDGNKIIIEGKENFQESLTKNIIAMSLAAIWKESVLLSDSYKLNKYNSLMESATEYFDKYLEDENNYIYLYSNENPLIEKVIEKSKNIALEATKLYFDGSYESSEEKCSNYVIGEFRNFEKSLLEEREAVDCIDRIKHNVRTVVNYEKQNAKRIKELLSEESTDGFKSLKLKEISKPTLFQTITNHIIQERMDLGDTELNMDEIFKESICYYSLFETLNTCKISKINRYELNDALVGYNLANFKLKK